MEKPGRSKKRPNSHESTQKRKTSATSSWVSTERFVQSVSQNFVYKYILQILDILDGPDTQPAGSKPEDGLKDRVRHNLSLE